MQSRRTSDIVKKRFITGGKGTIKIPKLQPIIPIKFGNMQIIVYLCALKREKDIRTKR
jgi:hypothetical protein